VPDNNGILYIKQDGAGDGSSWGNPLNGNDLQGAIFADSVKQVWVAKGTYKPLGWPEAEDWVNIYDNNLLGTLDEEREKHFTLKNKVEVYGGFAGSETELTQRDYKLNRSILSGDIGIENDSTDNCQHIFINIAEIIYLDGSKYEYYSTLDSTAVIDGFTIEKGYYVYSDLYPIGGAGMFLCYSSPTVRNCYFTKNHSTYDGGAVYSISSSTPGITPHDTSIFENCTFDNNSAEYYGGAIMILANYLHLYKINSCVFSNNRSGSDGGAINSWGNTRISNSLFVDNFSVNGASVLYFRNECGSHQNPILMNNTIVNNFSSNNKPAISYDVTSRYYSILSNNVIWNNGKAIFVDEDCWFEAAMNNCAIDDSIDFVYTGSGNITLSPKNTGDSNSPYFSDPDNGNWMIQEHSPLRDAGIFTELVPLYDIVGNLRDSIPDIGCYEWDPTGIEDDESALPLTTKLYQNYPNPFNPVTNIKFDLNKAGKVELSIYNIAGQLVRKIVDKEMPAGYHSVRFEADDLNSGMYFYTLKTADKKLTRKMLMVK